MKSIFCSFPSQNGKRPVLADDVDLDEIAAQTEGYTGADLAGLVKQASMFSLRQSLNNGDTNLDDLCVRSQHFQEALQQLRPSVNEQVRMPQYIVNYNCLTCIYLINRTAKYTINCA